MSDILIGGARGFQVVTSHAAVFEEDKEIAWAGAKDKIVIRPDQGWIVSKYVDLSPPEDLRPNDNGHIFTLADGERNFHFARYTPLNWLHHDQFIVGSNVDVELLYHLEEPAADAEALPPGAHVETLANFYRSIYPKHWGKVKDAHAAGLLHASMEAVPESVTCKLAGCCGETFPFKGVWSKTYCDSMQKPGREFILNNPLFLGAAVVVPPHRPGWRNANAVEVATWVEQHLDEAAQLYDQIAANHQGSDLSPDQIEAILAALVDAAGVGDGNGGRSRISFAVGDNGDFRFNLPTDLTLPTPAEVRALTNRPEVNARYADALEANHQGVIVALVPPPEIAAALAAMGDEPADQIHVTLAFLGDSGGSDTLEGPDGPVTRERLDAAVAVFAVAERPITARVSGLGRFAAPDGNEVTYASIDAPGLNELRARLVEYLRAAGVPVASDHGFTPHATIQYHPAGEGPTDLPDDLTWDVDSLELWWGDDAHIAHPFESAAGLDEAATALAVNAVRSLTDTDGPAFAAFEEFLTLARVEILQAVLDADAAVRGVHEILLAEAIIDRKFTTEQRTELAEKGQAMPDGSFPTPTKADWYNARAAIGRANPDDRGKIIAYLKRRATALGIPDDDIPDTW